MTIQKIDPTKPLQGKWSQFGDTSPFGDWKPGDAMSPEMADWLNQYQQIDEQNQAASAGNGNFNYNPGSTRFVVPGSSNALFYNGPNAGWSAYDISNTEGDRHAVLNGRPSYNYGAQGGDPTTTKLAGFTNDSNLKSGLAAGAIIFGGPLAGAALSGGAAAAETGGMTAAEMAGVGADVIPESAMVGPATSSQMAGMGLGGGTSGGIYGTGYTTGSAIGDSAVKYGINKAAGAAINGLAGGSGGGSAGGQSGATGMAGGTGGGNVYMPPVNFSGMGGIQSAALAHTKNWADMQRRQQQGLAGGV